MAREDRRRRDLARGRSDEALRIHPATHSLHSSQVGEEKIYDTLPPRLVRLELEDGRVRWSKDDLVDDFLFFLRCNHELLGMLYTHPSHPTDRPTRFILFAFSFSIGMAFEVLLQELMGETTETWVIGLWLGLVCSVIFYFLEVRMCEELNEERSDVLRRRAYLFIDVYASNLFIR